LRAQLRPLYGEVVDPKLSLAGLLVGVLVGATGMGGGSLMTPLLVVAFGFNPSVAVGTDLLHGGIFKTVGAVRHRRLGTVQARLSGWMLLGSGPSSLAGVWLATWLKDYDGGSASHIQMLVLGAALLGGGAGTLLKASVRFRERPDTPFVMTRRDRAAAVLIGLLGGFIVGLTSVGSGVFFGLTMLVVFPLRSAKVVGTDVLHAAALLWIAGLAHLAAGNVDLAAVGSLLVGSIPGVLVGSSLTVRLPDRALRLALGSVLVLSGVKLLEPPAADQVVVAGLAALIVAALGLGVRAWRRKLSASVVARRRPPLADVHWQRLDVSKQLRSELAGQRPCVLWLTGLSGAGKSTIANLVERRLYSLGHHTYLLDGDNVRHGLNRDLGFTDLDRVENIRRVAEVAKLMVDAGLIVVVSFISPFRSERALARALFEEGEFVEVFVDAPLPVAEARDPKGLYRKARAGELRNFTGIDSPYEPPENPELRLDTSSLTPEEALERVIALLRFRGFLAREHPPTVAALEL
jgi:adenylyl-sulfate kinase